MKSSSPFCQRHNLQHRGHPAMPRALRASSLSDVDACHKVGIMLEATEYTPKAIAIAVGFIDHTAPGTGLAGEFGGYLNHRYPLFKGLVGGEVLELSECPGVVQIPLFLSDPRPSPDKGQVLKSDGFNGSYGFPNNEPTYVVQHPSSEPFLPPAGSNKPSFRGAGASLLEFPALFHKMLAPLLQRRAAECCSRGNTSKLIKSTVYSDSTLDFSRCHFLPDSEVKVEGILSTNNLTLSEVPAGKVPCLVIASDYRNANSTLNGNHGEPIGIEPVTSAMKVKRAAIKPFSLFMPMSLPDYFTNKPGTEWRLAPEKMIKLFTVALKRQVKKSLVFIQSLKEDVIKVWGELKGNGFSCQHMSILT